MDYSNRAEKIGSRIKAERKRLKLSAEAFLPQIYMSVSSRKTLTAWERGKRIPDLDSLVRMAEVFKCDVGYLLGDYDQRTRKAADVCEVTGLSEIAVNRLTNMYCRIQEEKTAGWVGTVQEQELQAINLLLEKDYVVLWNIYQYVFKTYDTFSMLTCDENGHDKDIFDKDVLLCNREQPNSGTFLNIKDMQSVFMLSIQTGLIELRNAENASARNRSQKKQPPPKEW